MKYNFNERIDRSENHSAKWAEMEMKFGRSDLIPMWVADMDIKAAPEIVESMKKKVEQEIFGYVYRPDSYYKTATEWLKKRFGYEISPSSLIHSPGVVPSMSILVKMLTKTTDKILIQTPVYPPFASAVKDNGRELVENPLIKDEKGYYTIDFEDLEKKLSLDEVKLFILCNPHNPVGRVWKKEELLKMGELCKKYNVRILADEIWRDLIMPGYKHTPMASLSKDIEDITITLFSPTKSFNLAGLQASFATFPRAEERKEFDNILGQMDVKRNNPFSLVAFETAYEKCEDWLEELILHIDGNMQYVVDFIAEKLPEIKVVKPEGTYLMWLDFNGTKIPQDKIQEFLINEAKVAMNDGGSFGSNGKGFARMNVACPRYMVEEAMERIEKALKNLK
ncbi:MalY/PatB family protein [uncultured Fusobacterium sp.]|uniref:MalY/PatB family protein n=1 Tax=uncultured Fusobacterium sp. TaxID=159267 RepID=UPI0015A69AE9|nr:MalY/PatB family protein [uncultured Fusobacterium sp.]